MGHTAPPDIVENVEAVAEDADEDQEREEDDSATTRLRTFKPLQPSRTLQIYLFIYYICTV